MPFTLAHPAAIIPLPFLMGRAGVARTGVFAALVVGSIAPDLPYFLGDPFQRKTTHTLISVLWFSLPAGWLTYWVFEHAIRRGALFVLPDAFRARLRAKPQLGEPGPVSLCIVLGALTHLAWDALTHELGAYALLQVASTLGGLGAIAWATHQWLQRTKPRKLPPQNRAIEYRRFVARILVVATFLCTSPVAAIGIAMFATDSSTHPVVMGGHALLTGAGCTAALLGIGGLWLARGGLKA